MTDACGRLVFCNIDIVFVFKDIVVVCIGVVVDTKDIVVVFYSIVVVVFSGVAVVVKDVVVVCDDDSDVFKSFIVIYQTLGFFKDVDDVVADVLIVFRCILLLFLAISVLLS